MEAALRKGGNGSGGEGEGDSATCALQLVLSDRQKAALRDLVGRIASQSGPLQLSERDLHYLLRLLAQGKLLDPKLYNQLVSLLLRTFNLWHIPLKNMLSQEQFEALQREARRRRKLHLRRLSLLQGGQQLEGDADLSDEDKRRNWQLVPLYDPDDPNGLLSGARGGRLVCNGDDILGRRRSSSHYLPGMSPEEQAAAAVALRRLLRRRRNLARQMLDHLMSFYTYYAPLYNSFSCLLLAATRSAINRMLIAEAASGSEEARRRALAYFMSLQKSGSIDAANRDALMAPLSVLLKQFSGGQVR